MACCVVAAFLISQLLSPLRWLRAQFGYVPGNVAVSWSPGATEPVSAVASTSAWALIALTLTTASAIALVHNPSSPLCTHVARGN